MAPSDQRRATIKHVSTTLTCQHSFAASGGVHWMIMHVCLCVHVGVRACVWMHEIVSACAGVLCLCLQHMCTAHVPPGPLLSCRRDACCGPVTWQAWAPSPRLPGVCIVAFTETGCIACIATGCLDGSRSRSRHSLPLHHPVSELAPKHLSTLPKCICICSAPLMCVPLSRLPCAVLCQARAEARLWRWLHQVGASLQVSLGMTV